MAGEVLESSFLQEKGRASGSPGPVPQVARGPEGTEVVLPTPPPAGELS